MGGLLGDDMLDGLGMLARMLVVAPHSTAGTRMFQDLGEAAELPLAAYDERLRMLLEKPPRLGLHTDDVLDPEPLNCSPTARTLWIAFHDHAESNIGDGGVWRPIRAFGAKAAEHAGRLAAVLAAYAGEGEVSDEMMANGIALARHYAAEMIRLKGSANITPELRQAQMLLAWWREKDEPSAHLAEVYQRGPASLRNAAAARAACGTLQDHGWIKPMKQGVELDGAPRREAWELIP